MHLAGTALTTPALPLHGRGPQEEVTNNPTATVTVTLTLTRQPQKGRLLVGPYPQRRICWICMDLPGAPSYCQRDESVRTLTWDAAVKYCKARNLNGYSGRLCTANEHCAVYGSGTRSQMVHAHAEIASHGWPLSPVAAPLESLAKPEPCGPLWSGLPSPAPLLVLV